MFTNFRCMRLICFIFELRVLLRCCCCCCCYRFSSSLFGFSFWFHRIGDCESYVYLIWFVRVLQLYVHTFMLLRCFFCLLCFVLFCSLLFLSSKSFNALLKHNFQLDRYTYSNFINLFLIFHIFRIVFRSFEINRVCCCGTYNQFGVEINTQKTENQRHIKNGHSKIDSNLVVCAHRINM